MIVESNAKSGCFSSTAMGSSLIKPLGNADQNVAEVFEDAVITTFICIGKGCSGNRPTKSDVLEFIPMGIQACFNVPQTFAPR
jgi:hypothetical protein